jgi:hypothetical protein
MPKKPLAKAMPNNVWMLNKRCVDFINGSEEGTVWSSSNEEELNVVDDEVYFLNSGNHFVCKVGTDGTNASKV